MNWIVALMRRLGRMTMLLLLVALGTLGLVRYAPGYFADSREMDAQHAASARTELERRKAEEGSAAAMARSIAVGWLHGRLGVSRQYELPVGELIRPRLFVTLRLLGEALALGWLTAAAVALPLSARQRRSGETWIAVGSAFLLAVPIGALSTIFLLTDTGGPAMAIGLLIAARDFKFLYRLLQSQWRAPYLLHARAQGVRIDRLILGYLLPPMLPQLASLLTLSFVIALSLAVPAEVLFDVPGVGQLAWTAAINRDLPLLLAVTLLMATAVGCAGLFSEPLRAPEASSQNRSSQAASSQGFSSQRLAARGLSSQETSSQEISSQEMA